MTALDTSDLAERLRAVARGREDLVGRVCATLRRQIREGRVELGARLPSETELAKAMRVSRPTLREATRILAQEGLLDIRHGVGTFVTARTPHLTNALDSIRPLSASIRAAGGEPRVRALTIERLAAPREVGQALGLPAGAEVIRIRRVRLIDDRPLGLALEYLPLAEPVTLEAMRAFDGSSLYAFMATALRLTLTRSEMTVTAVSANAEQAGLLSVGPRAPLLLMRETHFGQADRRLLYSVNYQNSAVVDLTLVRAGVRT